MSNNHGITPLLWGESAWRFLHTVAATFPEHPTDAEKQHAFNFFLSLGYVLPCKHCKKHYKLMLDELNFGLNVFTSQETLFKFVYDMHNAVNARLKKPIATDYFYFRHKYDLYKQL